MPFLTGGRYNCPFFWCYMIFRATSIMLHNNIVINIKQVEFCILFHILCYFLVITFLWIKSFFELPAREWIHVGPPLFFLYVWFLGVAWKSCIFVASFKNVICRNKFSFRPMLCKSLFSAAVFCSITLWSAIIEYHLLLFIIIEWCMVFSLWRVFIRSMLFSSLNDNYILQDLLTKSEKVSKFLSLAFFKLAYMIHIFNYISRLCGLFLFIIRNARGRHWTPY